MKIKRKIPKAKKWLFWSYDIASLDLKEDKDYIIPQALNYGDWEDLKWLFKNYSRQEIKEAIKTAGRGIWFERVLAFWTKMLDIKLPKNTYQKAIRKLSP